MQLNDIYSDSVMDLYFSKPREIRDNIPVFSAHDSYIENYDKISADHLEAVSKTGSNPFIPENLWLENENATSSLIKKYAKPGDKILDVGVGLGRLLSKFTELDRYGMDISMEYLREARAKGIKCCLSLIEDMPYKDESFDIITCTDVLEHVLDLNLAIKNIFRVLKKNGVLIIRVPYREDLSSYTDPSCPYFYVHLRNFDENSLTLLFTRIFNCNILDWFTSGEDHNVRKIKSPYPEIRLQKSLVYRYHRLLKRFAPIRYARLHYHNSINMAVKRA